MMFAPKLLLLLACGARTATGGGVDSAKARLATELKAPDALLDQVPAY